MLRHIAEHSTQLFEKYTFEDLLRLQDLTPEEQLQHLNTVLHVGISKIILLLQDLPFGFCSIGPIRGVIRDYVQDIRDLRANGPEDRVGFQACVLQIFTRHRGMLGQLDQGLQDFQEEITENFRPTANLASPVCADVSDTIPGMRKIERTLDEFFTIRTTLRLLIAHCLQMSPEDHSNTLGFAMHELLQHRRQGRVDPETGDVEVTHVGAVCLNTKPSLILLEAYRHVHTRCQHRHKKASKLVINDMFADEFQAQQDMDQPGVRGNFPYVDLHLYFIFFEVLNAAMLASIRKVRGSDEEPPPVHASLITGTSLDTENERVVKITDFGWGINRHDIRRVWSYFPSTVKQPIPEGEGCDTSDVSLEQPSGRGLGLAVSRVLVRYFGGEIDLHSIPRKGTDVYIYL